MTLEETVKGLMLDQSPLFFQGRFKNDDLSQDVSKIWLYLLANNMIGQHTYPLTGKIKPRLLSLIVLEIRIAKQLDMEVPSRFVEVLIPNEDYSHVTNLNILDGLIVNRKDLTSAIRDECPLFADEKETYARYNLYICNLIEVLGGLQLVVC